jgi:hypothetical protein
MSEPNNITNVPPWWAEHQNLRLTAEFMARQQADLPPAEVLSNVLYMLEKPWKHSDDFALASAELTLPPELWNREES